MPDKTSRPLPSPVSLRAFEALGRLGSVRAAGDELAVSHTVISKHLRHLQETLGVVLMAQQGRRLVLTEDGRRYHQDIASAFAQMRRATRALRAKRPSKLNIWCTPGIVGNRLLSRLPELTGPPRDWDINLQPTLARPDLAGGEADALITYAEGQERDERIQVEELVRPRVFPVASPAFLAGRAQMSIEDIAHSALIHEESTEQWANWLALAGLREIPSLHGQQLWHAHIAIEGARLGQGIAIANDKLVEDELRSGALVEVGSSNIYMGSYRLLALRKRWTEPTISVLRQWLREAFRADPARPSVAG